MLARNQLSTRRARRGKTPLSSANRHMGGIVLSARAAVVTSIAELFPLDLAVSGGDAFLEFDLLTLEIDLAWTRRWAAGSFTAAELNVLSGSGSVAMADRDVRLFPLDFAGTAGLGSSATDGYIVTFDFSHARWRGWRGTAAADHQGILLNLAAARGRSADRLLAALVDDHLACAGAAVIAQEEVGRAAAGIAVREIEV